MQCYAQRRLSTQTNSAQPLSWESRLITAPTPHTSLETVPTYSIYFEVSETYDTYCTVRKNCRSVFWGYLQVAGRQVGRRTSSASSSITRGAAVVCTSKYFRWACVYRQWVAFYFVVAANTEAIVLSLHPSFIFRPYPPIASTAFGLLKWKPTPCHCLIITFIHRSSTSQVSLFPFL